MAGGGDVESCGPVGINFSYARWKISRDLLCSEVPIVKVLCCTLQNVLGGRDTRKLWEVLVLLPWL